MPFSHVTFPCSAAGTHSPTRSPPRDCCQQRHQAAALLFCLTALLRNPVKKVGKRHLRVCIDTKLYLTRSFNSTQVRPASLECCLGSLNPSKVDEFGARSFLFVMPEKQHRKCTEEATIKATLKNQKHSFLLPGWRQKPFRLLGFLRGFSCLRWITDKESAGTLKIMAYHQRFQFELYLGG